MCHVGESELDVLVLCAVVSISFRLLKWVSQV